MPSRRSTGSRGAASFNSHFPAPDSPFPSCRLTCVHKISIITSSNPARRCWCGRPSRAACLAASELEFRLKAESLIAVSRRNSQLPRFRARLALRCGSGFVLWQFDPNIKNSASVFGQAEARILGFRASAASVSCLVFFRPSFSVGSIPLSASR